MSFVARGQEAAVGRRRQERKRGKVIDNYVTEGRKATKYEGELTSIICKSLDARLSKERRKKALRSYRRRRRVVTKNVFKREEDHGKQEKNFLVLPVDA